MIRTQNIVTDVDVFVTYVIAMFTEAAKKLTA